MGQIIIDLPNKINRRYRLENKALGKMIIESLESGATPVKISREQLTEEDKADIRAAKRARKGDLISWEEAKTHLDKLD